MRSYEKCMECDCKANFTAMLILCAKPCKIFRQGSHCFHRLHRSKCILWHGIIAVSVLCFSKARVR